MTPARLDLEAIGAALGGLRADAENDPLGWHMMRREAMNADVIRRLMSGYRYVDLLLAGRVDIFAYGNSGHILELNHRVLCGESPQTRAAWARHMSDTAEQFYEERPGGIGDLVAWYSRHWGDAPRALAAGTFVNIVAGPQLFIEGNQRTATLIATYLLVRSALPPLVLTEQSYRRAFPLFAAIKGHDRSNVLGLFRDWRLRRALARLIADIADTSFLQRDRVAVAG